MARQSRLFLPSFPQLVSLQAMPGRNAFESRDHYLRFLSLLDWHARQTDTAVHAYALWAQGALLLLGTPDAYAAGRLVQGINRVYVPWRCNGGHLWQPRFKSTAVQPGLWSLRAALWVDSAPVRLGVSQDAAMYPFCSFAGHTGVAQDRLLTHLPVYFSLGNTPFDRQMAFRQLADQGIGEAAAQRLQHGLEKGWLVSDEEVVAHLQSESERPLVPRPRGRPPRKKS
jgi:putative transposase